MLTTMVQASPQSGVGGGGSDVSGQQMGQHQHGPPMPQPPPPPHMHNMHHHHHAAAMAMAMHHPGHHHEMYAAAVAQHVLQYEAAYYAAEYSSFGPAENAHLCALAAAEYGPVTVPMMSTNSSPPIGMPVQVPPGHVVHQVVDENGSLRHVILSAAGPPPPNGAPAAPLPPPNSTPGNYAPNGQFYAAYPQNRLHYGGTLQPPAANSPSSPPSPSPNPGSQPLSSSPSSSLSSASSSCSNSSTNGGGMHKDERTQRQYSKLKRKYDQKQRNNNCDANGSRNYNGSPPRSPKKELSNGPRHWKGGGSGDMPLMMMVVPSTPPHLHPHHMHHHHAHHHMMQLHQQAQHQAVPPMMERQRDAEEIRQLIAVLSTMKAPLISEVQSRNALLQWCVPSSVGQPREEVVVEEQPPLTETPRESEEGAVETDKPSETPVEEPPVEVEDVEEAEMPPEYVDGISEMDLEYEVLLSDKGRDGKYKSIYSGNSLSCRLADLRPATEYFISIVAKLSDDVRGEPSEAASFKTTVCEPDAPNVPTVSNRTRNSLQLRWTPPLDNGSRIAHYVLECAEGRDQGGKPFTEVFKGRSKQTTMNKLQPATWYRFRIAAVNDCGKSLYSEIAIYSTAGSPPTAPSAPELHRAGVSNLHLLWKGRPCDEMYCLQKNDPRDGYGFLNVYNGAEPFYDCQGLDRNTNYRFRLRASNDEGESPWSEEVSLTTLPDRPRAPSKPVVKGRIHAHAFKVKWDPPKDDGGAPISRYILEMSTGAEFQLAYDGPDTEFSCDRLVPGTTYQLRVSCIGPAGQSDPSDAGVVTTEPVCPGQCPPPRTHGKPKATTMSLKWAYPDSDGGAPISDFELDMTSPDNTTRTAYRGHATECLVAGLAPGRPYVFQVRAYNRVGSGSWSEPFEVVSGAGPPDRPKEPRVAPADHLDSSATVEWEQPLNNGAVVSEYRLEVGMSEGEKVCEGGEEGAGAEVPQPQFELTYCGPALSYVVRGLVPATLYYFRVQAVNSAGRSPPSPATSLETRPAPPAAVSRPTHSATCTSASLEWRTPPCHGSPILRYELCLGDSGEVASVTEGPVTSVTVHDLLPDTTYCISVRAVNEIGAGPFSVPVSVTTKPLPPSPPTLECVGTTHNTLKLRWGPENRTPTERRVSYMLEMENPKTKDFQTVYQGPATTHKVTRLSESTRCRFRISAANDSGRGPFSEPVELITSRAPPPPPKAPKVCDFPTPGTARVEWPPIRGMSAGGDEAVLYQLQLARQRELDYKVIYRGPSTQHLVTDLQGGAEYSLRVCALRCQNSEQPLSGAYSSVTTFSVPQQGNNSVCDEVDGSSALSGPHGGRGPQHRNAERRPLTDQQWAVVFLAGFAVVCLFVSVLIQQLVAT